MPAPSHVPLTALLITNGDAGLCIRMRCRNSLTSARFGRGRLADLPVRAPGASTLYPRDPAGAGADADPDAGRCRRPQAGRLVGPPARAGKHSEHCWLVDSEHAAAPVTAVQVPGVGRGIIASVAMSMVAAPPCAGYPPPGSSWSRRAAGQLTGTSGSKTAKTPGRPAVTRASGTCCSKELLPGTAAAPRSAHSEPRRSQRRSGRPLPGRTSIPAVLRRRGLLPGL